MKLPELSGIEKGSFHDFCHGWEGSCKWKIVWQSLSSRFVLVHYPSSLYMSGRDQNYATVEYKLHDRLKETRVLGMLGWEFVITFEGRRFSKAMLAEVVAAMRSYFRAEIRVGFRALVGQV